MRSLVVVNPAAGNGAALRVWQRVAPALSVAGIADWECVTSEGVGHARELARAAAQAGCERVVAVGGDGTVCEVANGVARTETAVAIVPTGTGNDSCRNLGVPSEPIAAARLALTGPIRTIDLGEIETSRGSTYFVNVAGFGFDAEVTNRVNALPKLVGGTVPYVLGVLQTLWQFRSPRMRIRLGDRTVERRVFLVAVANCASYAGGMRIAPDAIPDDGLFDVCMVHDLSRLAVLRLIPKLYSGGHRSHPAIELLRCREVHAESLVRVSCQADGELVGDLPASFRIHPGGLRCITGPYLGRVTERHQGCVAEPLQGFAEPLQGFAKPIQGYAKPIQRRIIKPLQGGVIGPPLQGCVTEPLQRRVTGPSLPGRVVAALQGFA